MKGLVAGSCFVDVKEGIFAWRTLPYQPLSPAKFETSDLFATLPLLDSLPPRFPNRSSDHEKGRGSKMLELHNVWVDGVASRLRTSVWLRG